MLRAIFFGLVATVLVSTLAAQVPFDSDSRWHTEHHPPILADEDTAEWRLDKFPDPNTTDHLVFETVSSLLQHWPNTRMKNGHTVVPGRIPAGTLLYHGTGRKEFPPGPEWVATDPEHSYVFCLYSFKHVQHECWHLTLVTTRPLKVVYFDGGSAMKLPFGPMDTQDLILWGRLGPDEMLVDWQRIQDLCQWGKNFGVDGFVRMSVDFEVMLCNFTSGVRVVSFVNLVKKITGLPWTPSSVSFEFRNAASWHDHFPGETRIQLDLAGLVSFYDTQLVPSLVGIRAGQERWDHRAQNTSSEDIQAVKSRLEAVLIRPEGLSNGVDWKALIQAIVDRYAERLELIRYLLNSSVTDPDEIFDLASKTQNQLRIMLTPYLLITATPTDQSDKVDMDWTIPIYKLCATTHTYFMESELASMTDSEKLLLKAVRGTNQEICRVVTQMWAAGVYAGIDGLLNTKQSLDIAEISHLRTIWAEDLDRLMTWLDWNVWVKCNLKCGPEEMCYLPSMPVPSASLPNTPHPERPTSIDSRTMVTESLAEKTWNSIKPEPSEWMRPQPKCIRRVEPYDF